MELLHERLAQIQADLAELEQGVVPGEEGPSLAQALPSQSPLTRDELLQETARLLALTKASIPDRRPGEGTKLRAGATAIPERGSGDTSRLRLYEPGGTQHAASGTTQRQTSVGATRPDLAGVAAGQPRTRDALPEDATGTANVQVSSASVKAFQRHLGAAEYYLDCGQYMRAAESFALAATCLPNNARAHLGRSHALLAAGEYAGSALALAEAIELDSQLVLRQWDLVRIVGGPDAFISRFNELEKAAKAGRAPQLQLLLAYIYYQMERPQEAKVAIEIAYNAMPSSVPVDLLKAAIGQ
jgi:tetratricopeptide (TPR) repeat protein